MVAIPHRSVNHRELPQSTADTALVLIADDDAGVRRMLARALRSHGFRVTEASDGQQALELSRFETPDLAVVDLCMPNLGGIEVVRELKARHEASLPVLMLSGTDDPEERVRAFEAGADDFVAKPVYVHELLKRVDAFERTRRALREARLANERADRLRMFVAEAAALLAHDLNNGLSIAKANLEYLSEEMTFEGEELDALTSTERALHRMTSLVRNFVDISRLEDDAIKPERSTVEVAALLRSVVEVHRHASARTTQPIDVDCAPDLRAHIDPMLAERILHNLLNNATRYVNHGGTIGIRARLEEAPGGCALVLGVGNTGAPIAPELRANMFTKYRRGRDGKAQRGMGLYFCRLASEAHGGSIGVEDDPRFATYFVVRLRQ